MANQVSTSVAADIFCGAGIGVLLGVLVGLSANAVVADVVVGIVALLAAALGLVSASEKIGVRPWRIGAFGVVASLSVMVAVMIRTHDALAPSALQQHRSWVSLGFTAREAGQLVAYRQLGVMPNGAQVDTAALKGKASLLYAADGATCRELEPTLFADDAEVVTAWRLQQGPWAQLADIAATLAPQQGRSLLKASWMLACNEEAL